MHNWEWSQNTATRDISLNVDKILPHEVLKVDHICSFLRPQGRFGKAHIGETVFRNDPVWF